jgi:riboflavin transporter FmnP
VISRERVLFFCILSDNKDMFENLIHLAYRRNKKEALSFYIASLFLFTAIGALIASGYALLTGTDIQNLSTALTSRGEQIGAVIIAIGSAVLSIAILSAKKESRYGFALLALAGGILSLFGGALLGFIIPAYLTTRPAPEDTALPH